MPVLVGVPVQLVPLVLLVRTTSLDWSPDGDLKYESSNFLGTLNPRNYYLEASDSSENL